MNYDLDLAEELARQEHRFGEEHLIDSFVSICAFLNDHPDRISSRTRQVPDLHKLLSLHFKGYRKRDIPIPPQTVPDPAVSMILQAGYGYEDKHLEQIKIEHQQSMGAENCVGALLERYIDSVAYGHGWFWCCGDFVRGVDFIYFDDRNDQWIMLQVKNRDNTENSSSSAIRSGTRIIKWFRTFSKSTARSRACGFVNWDNLPPELQYLGLCEEDFIEFAKKYVYQNM